MGVIITRTSMVPHIITAGTATLGTRLPAAGPIPSGLESELDVDVLDQVSSNYSHPFHVS